MCTHQCQSQSCSLCLQTKFHAPPLGTVFFYISHQNRSLSHHDLDCAMMSKLLIILAFSITLFLVLTTQPADAGVKGSLTSKGGHACALTERSKPNNVCKLRLDCTCKDNNDNEVEYQCYYRSVIDTCCTKGSDTSADHYHSYEPAYYGQLAE